VVGFISCLAVIETLGHSGTVAFPDVGKGNLV